MVSSRSGKVKYVNLPQHQGRQGAKRGSFEGRKERDSLKRRSARKKGEEPSDDDEPPPNEDTKPSTQVKHRLRNRPITCLTFGPRRKALFPYHFFCGNCDWWEKQGGGSAESDAAVHFKASATRSSVKYKCIAGHTSAIFPTTRDKEAYLPSSRLPTGQRVSGSAKNKQANRKPADPTPESKMPALAPVRLGGDSDASDTDESYESESSEASSNDELDCDDLCEPDEKALLRERLAKLEATNAGLVTANARLRKGRGRQQDAEMCDDDDESHDDLTTKIRKAIECVIILDNRGRLGKSVHKAIAMAAVEAFEGAAESEVHEMTRKWYRKNVWSAWEFGRMMDDNGGCVNYKGIELIREMEKKGNKYVRTFLPSSSQIKRLFKRVNNIGQILAPYQLTFDDGETIKFDYRKTLRHILRSFGLDRIAIERAVKLASSIDGARLTAHINNVMAGMKIRDRGAICPRTQTPLLSDQNKSHQSRDVCFPFHLNLGKETKQKFDGEFRQLFEFWLDIGKNGMDGSLPYCMATETDLSAAWKGLMRGGGAKAHDHPCHCCGAHSDHLHHPNEENCSRFCEAHDEDSELRCYHTPIITDERMKDMEEELDELIQTVETEVVQYADKTELTNENPCDNKGRENSTQDPFSIHFIPRTHGEVRAYSGLMNAELIMRGMPCNGQLLLRTERLRQRLKYEHRMVELKKDLDICARPQSALFLLMETIPCILHMEMRVGLKILTMVLIEGLAESKAGRLFHDHSEGRRVDLYIQSIEKIMNEEVLGHISDKASWTFPYDTTTKKLGTISFENTKVRKVVQRMDRFIDASVTDQARQVKWKRCMPKYRVAVVIARQKEDFQDEDIIQFQKSVDEWFSDYVFLTGKNGMTNYIHLLCTGHLAEYMYKWRNLYEHSQQGWEAFNSLLKSFFFRRTQRGGGRGVTKTKLQPIGKWLQRRMLWMCGLTLDRLVEYERQQAEEPTGQAQDDEEDVEEEQFEEQEEQEEQEEPIGEAQGGQEDIEQEGFGGVELLETTI